MMVCKQKVEVEHLQEIHEGLHGCSFVRANLIRSDHKGLPVNKSVLHEPPELEGIH